MTPSFLARRVRNVLHGGEAVARRPEFEWLAPSLHPATGLLLV